VAPRLKLDKKEGGVYYDPPSDLKFISTGCTLLNLVISGRRNGGYVLGRLTNIIGDKSTGKTLLAIEACANFLKQYPKGKIYYREAESAFDKSYAKALGMPVSQISFLDDDVNFDSVEDFYEDLDSILDKAKPGQPGLYILDSLDALSDRAELARKIDAPSYGGNKAKQMSQLFRRLIRKINKTDMAVIIISQIRDNIGAMFGDKTTRSGGRALDFYASQVVKLAHLKSINQTINGQKRTTGILIKAKCTKNKISVALRSCQFTLAFGFGVDSFAAGMEWLIEAKRTKDMGLSIAAAEQLIDDSVDWDDVEYRKRSDELDQVVAKAWNDIETSFLPRRRKYT
jgi:recombination protein RecA